MLEEIISTLYKLFSSIFQWALIYSFFLAIGSAFLWIITLGKYPKKDTITRYDTEVFFLSIGVVLGILYLLYFIST